MTLKRENLIQLWEVGEYFTIDGNNNDPICTNSQVAVNLRNIFNRERDKSTTSASCVYHYTLDIIASHNFNKY